MTQGIKLNPDYAGAYFLRGNAYNAKEDYDHAIADYTQAIKLDPDNASYKEALKEAKEARG